MDIREIKKYLPHRFPMLLVDRVLEVEQLKSISGYKNVTANEAFFEGHYPEMPIMPGVLIIEAMAQMGALMLLTEPTYSGQTPVIVGVEKAKFKKPVVPGDRLDIRAEVMWFRNSLGMMKGTAKVGDEVVAEAEIGYKILPNGDKA
ncbi:MAG: 3-hydroxyacyl-ACP dehydratase FabZ [Fimbriimonadales bacterium]